MNNCRAREDKFNDLEVERQRIEKLARAREVELAEIELRMKEIAFSIARLLLPAVTDHHAAWINERLRKIGADFFEGSSLTDYIAAGNSAVSNEVETLRLKLETKNLEASQSFYLRDKSESCLNKIKLLAHLLEDWAFDEQSTTALLELYLEGFGTENYKFDRWSPSYWRHRYFNRRYNRTSKQSGVTMLGRLTDLMGKLNVALEERHRINLTIDRIIGACEEFCRISFELRKKEQLLEDGDDESQLLEDWQEKLGELLALNRGFICALEIDDMPGFYSPPAIERIESEFKKFAGERQLLESLTYDFVLLQEDLSAVKSEISKKNAPVPDKALLLEPKRRLRPLNDVMTERRIDKAL